MLYFLGVLYQPLHFFIFIYIIFTNQICSSKGMPMPHNYSVTSSLELGTEKCQHTQCMESHHYSLASFTDVHFLFTKVANKWKISPCPHAGPHCHFLFSHLAIPALQPLNLKVIYLYVVSVCISTLHLIRISPTIDCHTTVRPRIQVWKLLIASIKTPILGAPLSDVTLFIFHSFLPQC